MMALEILAETDGFFPTVKFVPFWYRYLLALLLMVLHLSAKLKVKILL